MAEQYCDNSSLWHTLKNTLLIITISRQDESCIIVHLKS